MYELLWIFFVYAFLGWCVEVAFVALQSGHFVNRGFLNGPLCPIYGFGVNIVLIVLTPLKDNFLLLFLGSLVLASLLEWVTGFLLEKLFHQRWWDYSDEPFNLNGYICLRFSILWGLACVLVVDIIHPTVLAGIRLIPHTAGVVLLIIMGAYLAVDLIATVRTITKMNRRLERIDELAGRIHALSDELGEGLADHVLEAAERGADWKETVETWKDSQQTELSQLREDLEEDVAQRRDALRQQLEEIQGRLREQLESVTAGQRRLLKAFPQLRSVDRADAMDRVRRVVERRHRS